MESKKFNTVINAEEEHLVSKSAKITKKIVKKSVKTSSKTEQLVSSEIKKTESVKKGVEDETKIQSTSAITNDAANEINVNAKKKNKSKKPKKCEYDNQNISVKSSFNKFDALQKRNLIHVRSSDSSKAQEIFSNPQDEQQTNCRLCSKPVYKMEEVVVQFKTDKSIYHKSCLRCKECAKQLKFDSYQSHEGNLYCNVHFKSLFAPKVVEQAEEPKSRRTELIIRESQPTELPPDVVRASDKPDLGLDELHQLNVRSRFQAFENVEQRKLEEEQLRLQQRPVIKRSTSVLEKYRMKSQVGDNDSSADEDDEEEENEDADLMRSKRSTQKERPVGLGDAMNDIKTRFEKGTLQSKEERREERKQEIQNIRSRLFMGKQAKIKEMYQQAVAESGQARTSIGKQPDVEIGDAARSIKQRFENGEMFAEKGDRGAQADNNNAHGSNLSEDAEIFESAISKKSRSIFMELDANIASNTNANRESLQRQQSVNPSRSISQTQFGSENVDIDVIKSDAKPEDVKIETAELSQKFKFFETYRPKDGEKRRFRITPPREGVVKMPSPDSDTDPAPNDKSFHDNVLQKTQTTSTMLNKFRELEQNPRRGAEQIGPRPLKCFTPPPPENRQAYYDKSNSEEEEEDEESDEEEDDESEIDKEILALSASNGDEALKEAQSAARAKQLRAKFEKWQANEIKRELIEGYVDIYSQQVSDDSTIETAKAIRDRFENMTNLERKSPTGPRYQVNRFV